MPDILHIFNPSVDFNEINSKSKLLDNVQNTLTESEYHTSLGDLSSREIISIADQFKKINFLSDGFDKQSDIYMETKSMLNFLSHFHLVTNFVTEPELNFVDRDLIKVSSKKQKNLWVFGCSHSHGTGLDQTDLRYSNILSRTLHRSLQSVTEPGSSLDWSLGHLVNADVQPQDLVIWQITTPYRIRLARSFDNDPEDKILNNCDNKFAVLFYDDLQIFYKHCYLLNLGVRYLRSKKAKFVLTSLDVKDVLYYKLMTEYTKYKEYCYIPDINQDLGNDSLHFGPKSHEKLADHLLYHFKKLNYV